MSDEGRKDWTTKAKEEITPDSSKSTQDKVKETFTDTSDRVQRGVQSDENKSTGQEIYDKAQRMKDDHNGGASGTIGDKIKDTLGLGGGESK